MKTNIDLISNEKLIEELLNSNFNFAISAYIDNKPNFEEPEKTIIYEKELLNRLNEKEK
jgi:hypothetical protein